MKSVLSRPPVSVACFCLLAAVAFAEDESKATNMLKVPPAEARAVGDGATDKEAEASPSPDAESSPAGATTPLETGESGDEVVLPAFPLTRYKQLWERSPFQLESVAPPAESVGIAQKFALTGIAQINGEPIAFLMDRATQNRLMVKKEPNEAGLSLVKVDVPEKYSESTATVRQGTEVGTIRFEAAPGMPVMAAPAIPQQRPMPAGIPQAPAIPQVVPAQGALPPVPQIPGAVQAQPVPGGVPGVPGGAVPGNTQVQGNPNQMPPPRVIRRRALIPAAP